MTQSFKIDQEVLCENRTEMISGGNGFVTKWALRPEVKEFLDENGIVPYIGNFGNIESISFSDQKAFLMFKMKFL